MNKATTAGVDEGIDANGVEEMREVEQVPVSPQHLPLAALRQFGPSLSVLAASFLIDLPDFLQPLVGGGSHHG